MKVRAGGHTVGDIEQVGGGNWFATHGMTPLGAFRTRNQARAAVIACHHQQPIVGRIETTILIGPAPRGQ